MSTVHEKKKNDFIGGLKPSTSPKGDISFQNIVFSYPNRPDAPIINGLDLEIPSGQRYALVGHSGSGKSTLGNLLLRLYDPQNGQICLDKTNIQLYDPVWLHSHIGVVSQVSDNSLTIEYSNCINGIQCMYFTWHSIGTRFVFWIS